ncbi:MAG: hypothetical protein ACREJY_14230 [Candidatus Rokuibacteriota bacterium]
MANGGWSNPWKLTAIGMALVIVTALVTGLVVANWSGTPVEQKAPAVGASTAPRVASSPVSQRPVSAAPARQPVSTVPTQAAIDACHRSATAQVGQHDKTMEVVKDGAIGAAVGAAVGAAGGAIAGGGKGAGQGAAIGGIVGAGGGSLYGLNENQKHDQRYREAYGSCMRARGYTG